MNESDQKKAIAALKSLMTKLRDFPCTYTRFSNVEEPLPEELSLILKFLAATCKQLTHLKNENSETNKVAMSTKQLCAAARIVRQILHVQQVSDYRALGLSDGATQEQIHNHYRWLSNLFAFDESIDPEHPSVHRTMQAYITLKDLRLSSKGDTFTSKSVQELNPDSIPVINEQIVNEQIIAPVRTPEVNQRKRSGTIITSILVLLTVSSGLGWWWLLSGHNIKQVTGTTFSKTITPPKNESQKLQQVVIVEENKTNKPESITKEKPN